MSDRITTMVVDDQDDIRFLIRTLLETAGDGIVVIAEAPDGPTALDLLRTHDPEIIVLDWMMPGMNGIDTATEINRERPGTRIILCSAFGDDVLRREAEAAGIARFVPKEEIGTIPELIRELHGH